MYRAVYQNPYDAFRSQAVHQRNLRKAKAVIDVSEPQEQPHLMSKAKKHEQEEDRFAEIERENAILLAKMSKIMREGAGTEDVGGAPPVRKKQPVYPAAQSLNRSKRKKDLMRITQENQAILQRIQLKEPFYNHLEWAQSRKENKKYMRQHCVHPPPGTKKKESKFAKQLRGQVGNKGSATSRGPAPRRHQVKESGAATSREYRSEPPASHRAANPENRVNHALELMRADDMRLLLGMKRPPEIVKKVFAALMIVVSPFDTTESDISWEAVHEWVRQLHGVDSFLDNLNHFGSTQIAPPIVQNTLDFLSHADLFPAKVKAFSGALATLCTWIWSVCESSQPQLTQAYRQQHKGYLPSDAQYEGGDDYQRAIEEEVEGGEAATEGDYDYGFVKGETVGSPKKL